TPSTSDHVDDLACDLRSGKYRSEMPLAISAGFGSVFSTCYFGSLAITTVPKIVAYR
ncbi:hypothetical protein J6590_100301, partial [Homalodisca vitripennis]